MENPEIESQSTRKSEEAKAVLGPGCSGCPGSISSSAIFVQPFVVVDFSLAAGDLCQWVSIAWAEGLAAGQDAGLSWGTLVPIPCGASVCRAQLGTIVPALQGFRIQRAGGASGLSAW